MDQTNLSRLIKIYTSYKELSWTNDFNFSFWKIMLDQSVKKLKEDTEKGLLDRDFLSQGICAVFDVPDKNETGWLHTSAEVKEITIDTIDHNQNSFLYEVINLSMIRHYNAIENMLLESINVCYGQIPQFDVYNRTCITSLKIQITKRTLTKSS